MIHIYKSPDLALQAIVTGRELTPYQPSVPHVITEPMPRPSSTVYQSAHAHETADVIPTNESTSAWSGFVKAVAATALVTVVALGFIEATDQHRRDQQIEQYYNNLQPGMQNPYNLGR